MIANLKKITILFKTCFDVSHLCQLQGDKEDH